MSLIVDFFRVLFYNKFKVAFAPIAAQHLNDSKRFLRFNIRRLICESV